MGGDTVRTYNLKDEINELYLQCHKLSERKPNELAACFFWGSKGDRLTFLLVPSVTPRPL